MRRFHSCGPVDCEEHFVWNAKTLLRIAPNNWLVARSGAC